MNIYDPRTVVMAKHSRLRQLLAERNLSIASNMRLIDDIPTRTELIQYERRFTELYQQACSPSLVPPAGSVTVHCRSGGSQAGREQKVFRNV
jgi:hypothetical protein